MGIYACCCQPTYSSFCILGSLSLFPEIGYMCINPSLSFLSLLFNISFPLPFRILTHTLIPPRAFPLFSLFAMSSHFHIYTHPHPHPGACVAFLHTIYASPAPHPVPHSSYTYICTPRNAAILIPSQAFLPLRFEFHFLSHSLLHLPDASSVELLYAQTLSFLFSSRLFTCCHAIRLCRRRR